MINWNREVVCGVEECGVGVVAFEDTSARDGVSLMFWSVWGNLERREIETYSDFALNGAFVDCCESGGRQPKQRTY
jgi:hypothetical protein